MRYYHEESDLKDLLRHKRVEKLRILWYTLSLHGLACVIGIAFGLAVATVFI